MKENKVTKKSFFRNSGEKKVLRITSENDVKSYLFYTDISNILFILENGINPVNNIRDLITTEYTVWSYLEHDESIGLEFDNSNRKNFWGWIEESEADIKSIAVIGIDPSTLSDITVYDWSYDDKSKTVAINEPIGVEAIQWIMVKEKAEFNAIKARVSILNLKIRIFLGDNGSIIES
ncbi:acetyltransferase [Spiroplasma sp. TIUS-1]|uniref:acetyltransferase n=1 Tax=Spiroplasma sp. TIUS-1 TaxID=216963 RepID=UPI0013978E8C|nr:acetyltransferase [Spiroplasma sp. TIUS-1]QHX35716.1 acetyltransferase [Spiroplasma sp. TIUS-1]